MGRLAQGEGRGRRCSLADAAAPPEALLFGPAWVLRLSHVYEPKAVVLGAFWLLPGKVVRVVGKSMIMARLLLPCMCAFVLCGIYLVWQC